MDQTNKEPASDTNSLEQPSTSVEGSQTGSTDTLANGATASQQPIAPSPLRNPNLLISVTTKLNIYLLGFILLLIIAGAIGAILYLRAKDQAAANSDLTSQSLSQSTLDQLANSDVTVGEPKHTLNIQSDAVFNGSVLVRSNLQIAGSLQVGSSLAINGIRVTGNSTFDDVQITKSLTVTGVTSLQGQLNIDQSLNVKGTATFLGAVSAPSLTVGTLQMSGDLNLTHHITAGGAAPSRANGTALGSGGTVSVSGSDTAGSITINTGSIPAAGCFVTITFATAFNATPHIVVTPIGVDAAGLSYYVNRTSTNFSVCTLNPASTGRTFGFDYVAFD